MSHRPETKLTVENLCPFSHNPRRISPEAAHGLAASIHTFGDISTIVFNRRIGALVAGHQRVAVLRERGAEVEYDKIGPFLRDPQTSEVFRVRVVDWDEPTHRAACIAANSPAIAGEFTKDVMSLLAEVKLDMPEAFSDLRLDELARELGEHFAALDLGDPDPPVEEDDVPEPEEGAITQPGDLWILGEHRLLCGDATKPEDVERVMAGERAALVATDPPYLVDYDGKRPGDSGKDWSGTYHEVDIKDAEGFIRSVFTNVLAVLAEHAAVYCWHADKRHPLIAAVWDDLGILRHQTVVWVKPSSVLGHVFWHYRHEPCLMGWRQGSKPPHDGRHDHGSIWEVDWGGKARIVGNEHPTQKPVELFARPMRKHTKKGDLCFEPFSGSGSQIIAAEQLGRRCRAIEVEPVFVDVAVRRWCRLTGREAVRDGDGFVFPVEPGDGEGRSADAA